MLTELGTGAIATSCQLVKPYAVIIIVTDGPYGSYFLAYTLLRSNLQHIRFFYVPCPFQVHVERKSWPARVWCGVL